MGIKTAVLNPELPLNSRHSILRQFEKGIFSFLIATDGPDFAPPNANNLSRQEWARQAGEEQDNQQKAEEATDNSALRVARGIDFHGVRTVLNFDLPLTTEAYTHRIGRTARAGQSGTALSLINIKEPTQMKMLE